MANKQVANQEPLTDPEAAPPIVDKIRIVLSDSDVVTIEGGKLRHVAGTKAEVYLPTGKRGGLSKPDAEFFGNNVGEVFTFLAGYAEDRTIAEVGNKVRAGDQSTNGTDKDKEGGAA